MFRLLIEKVMKIISSHSSETKEGNILLMNVIKNIKFIQSGSEYIYAGAIYQYSNEP